MPTNMQGQQAEKTCAEKPAASTRRACVPQEAGSLSAGGRPSLRTDPASAHCHSHSVPFLLEMQKLTLKLITQISSLKIYDFS